jgi:hypothetical protein
MSLINRLNLLCICHRIRRDNRFESRQNRFQRCHWHRGNRKWGLGNPQLFSASSTRIVWGYLPLKYFCWIFPLTEAEGLGKSVWDFSNVTLISAVSLTPLKFGGSNSVVYVPMKFFTLPSHWFQRCQWHRWNSNMIDFLGEYEAICKKRLYGVNQGPRGDCLMKKNRWSKISCYCPFNEDVS